MLLVANKRNLKKLAVRLLQISPTDIPLLIGLCNEPLRRSSCHISRRIHERLQEIDKLIGTHGVEGIFEWRTGGQVDTLHYRKEDVIDIQYCNTGDTYKPTILHWDGKFRIGDWGHIVERLSRNNQNQ